MSKYMDRAKELRACTSIHYNCAQSVLIPFAADAGLSEEDAFRVAANFRSGMLMGGSGGAFTGGLMALGVWGVDDQAAVQQLTRAMKANHEGTLDCAKLLAKNAELGNPRKPHCDDMVYEAVELVEKILREQGKISG